MNRPAVGAPTLVSPATTAAVATGGNVDITASPAPATLCGTSGCTYAWSASTCTAGATITLPAGATGTLLSLAVGTASGSAINVAAVPAGTVAECSVQVVVTDAFSFASGQATITVQVRARWLRGPPLCLLHMRRAVGALTTRRALPARAPHAMLRARGLPP